MPYDDIKTTGALNWRALQKRNRERFDPSTASEEDKMRMAVQIGGARTGYSPEPVEEIGLEAAQAGYGNSQYDDAVVSAGQLENIGEVRYAEQPWTSTLANGVGKMLGTAATTFVSSLVGMPYGLGAAIAEGRWSALWDNDVTQGLANVNEWLENNMTNYKSEAQQNASWSDPKNLFSMNFIADDIIKNAGFTLGAAASMAVGAGSLGLMSKALGLVNDVGNTTKMASSALAALFSATGEGMIEAKQGVEERNKLEMQRLEDQFAPEKEALEEEFDRINAEYEATKGQSMVMGNDGKYYDPAHLLYKQRMEELSRRRNTMNQRLEEGRKQIEESGLDMGNKILLGNQVLLTAGNMIQFGKAMTKSFDNARHAAEINTKIAKPFGVRAAKAGKDFTEGYVLKGKGWGRLGAATKGFLTEGSEEMNQQFIQSSAGAAYNEEDVNDYWKAKLDPEAYRETTKGLYALGNILDKGFQDSWGSWEQWEQFVIGGITGLAGSYSPTKIFNQDKEKSWYDPRRYGSWEGGAVNEIKEFNSKYKQYSENIDDLNKILAQEDFGSRTQNFIAHTYLEGNKEYAAADNDKKTWKDEDDKQVVHDIQAFLRAGKLDDLRAIYNEMGKDLSDEDIESIVKSTSTEKEIDGKKVPSGPFFDDKGNRVKTNDEIREEIKHNSEELNRKLNSYLESVDYINKRTGGQLSKDQEDNLAYLHNLSKEKDVRFQKIMSSIRKLLPSKFLIKTTNTPEQLTKQYASSDLAFNKTDDTPEGYVEVDTSLMNDSNFGAFFADTILWGDNIQPSYTKEDIMEELEAREEDKKYSEEEQKKRREERAKKQQEKANRKAQEAENERQEQQDKNISLIRKAFVDNAMQNNGKSLVQALNDDALNQIIDDINDALELRNEAAVFENTLREYMLNPQKVDQAKNKAEKANEDKIKKQKEDNASVEDMMDMDDDTLAAAVLGGRKGKNKNGKKAQKAMGIKNGRSKAEKSLDAAVASGKITREAADDALKLMDNQINKMFKESDEDDYEDMKSVASKLFDTETEAMDDEEALWDDDYRDAVVNGTVEIDSTTEEEYQARLDAAKDALNLISEDVEKQLEEYDQSIDMGKQFKDMETEEEKGTKELDEIVGKAADEKKAAENPTPTSSRNKSEGSEPLSATKPRKTSATASVKKKNKKSEPEPAPIEEEKLQTSGDDAALEEDKKKGEKGDNNTYGKTVWGLWHTGVSEVGKNTNEPWQADPSNPNAELQQNRHDIIKKKLINEGAYTARKQGKIKPDMKVGFKIFQDVNAATKDFVVFITDEHGNIIGDLPSEDARFNVEKFPMSMDALYKALHEEWDDATEEERKAGMQSQYATKIDEVLVGKVRYQKDRQTVKSLTQGSEVKPLFAIKRPVSKSSDDKKSGAVELRMDTGVDEQGKPNVYGINMPLTGKEGQPYVLIQTPGVHNGSSIKYLAVPIKTLTIGELIGNDTIFEGVLRNVLQRMKGKTATESQISDFEARRILEALLSVYSVHVNLEEGSDTKKDLGIRIRTHVSQSGITKGVPYTIYAGKREDMDVDAIIEALSGIQVNVSNQLINSKNNNSIAKYLTINGTPVNYNEMLAEVAHTNAAEPMTVNDWFTIKPLQEKDGKLEVVENSVKMPLWSNVGIDNPTVNPTTDPGKTWTVKISEGYTVYDEEGKQITSKTHSKEKVKEAAILAAEEFGRINSKPNNRPYAVLINGKSYIFNPVKRTFKTYAQAEKDPAYVYGKAAEGKKLTEQEKYTIMKDALERQKMELDEMYEERRRQQESTTPQQIGMDMVTHLKEMSEDVEIVDNAEEAAKGLTDAQFSQEELDEMETIKEQAIKDGTFMLAPNGKESNLNERQWLQVRTKAFKEWFGDWEKLVNFDTTYYYHSSNANFTEFDINNHNNSSNYNSFGYGIHLSSSPNNLEGKHLYRVRVPKDNGNNYLQEGVKGTFNELIDIAKKYNVNLEIFRDKVINPLLLTKYLAEHADRRTFLKIMQKSKYDGAKHEDGTIGIIYKNESAIIGDNSVSKVVDENGEPLVAYHGTPNKFTVFKRGLNPEDEGVYGKGLYFTNWKSYAEEYGKIIMPVFLNIRNPKIMEEDDFSNYGKEIIDNDGVIANIYLIDENAKEIVVTQPTQIKSATANSGAFDGSNPDIRMMVIGEKGARNLDAAEEATTRMDNLSVANEMEKAGKDALTIKIATGWERGADDKWRYEIPDVEINGGLLYKAVHNKTSIKLTDLIYYKDEHLKRFFTAYPVLKDYKISFGYMSKENLGGIIISSKTIILNLAALKISSGYISSDKTSQVTSVLIHEIQHIIQNEEDFAQGGHVSTSRDAYLKQEGLYDVYHRLHNIVGSRMRTLQRILSKDSLYIKYWNIANDVGRILDMFSFEEMKDSSDEIKALMKQIPGWEEGVNYDSLADKRKEELEKKYKKSLDAASERERKAYEKKAVIDKSLPSSYEAYRRLAGEVEARAASKRMKLSMEERRNSLFTDDMYKDVAKEDLIFLQKNINDNQSISFLKTASGKILGFEYNGKIYLQRDAINPNLPMHEYTHLWDRVIKEVDPRLWNKGKKLMQEDAADLWKEIAESENYGKRWEEEGKTKEELEDLIASEVHARLTGNGFEEYVRKHPNNSFAKLRKLLLDIFKKLAKTLGLSDAAINNLTLSDWNNMTVRDFMEKSITMNTIQEARKESNKDHTEEVNKVLEQMEEERKHYKLVKWDSKQKKYVEDKNGDYYRDDRDGSIHARVSNVNDADIDVITANKKAGFGGKSPTFVPSTGAGNVVDTFGRRFYSESVGLFEGIDWNNKDEAEAAMELAEVVNEQIGVPNISAEDGKNLIIQLAKIKKDLGQDWEINSSGIVASGIVSFDGETIVKVAGTIDLLAYNRKTGQYAIIDMKTHLAPLFRKDGKLKTDSKTLAKFEHWRAQQTMYKQFLETKYGIKISGLRIMGFGVNYSTNFKETDYVVDDDGVLRDKGIVVDISPKYDGKLIRLEPKTNVKYDVGQLPESVKRLLPRKKAAIVKQPDDEETAVKGKLISIRDSVPEGRSLKEFISDKYKNDDNVKKLVDILEANKGEATPVMMTQGSQNLLMDAIDQAALDKAVQENNAAKEKLKIDIPTQEEADLDDFIEMLENRDIEPEFIDFVKDLSEELQRKLMKGSTLSIALDLFNQEAEDSEIEQAIKNFDLNARNKKAVREYTLIDLPKELRWMRENLPQLSSERRLHIIKGLIRCSDGTESFGQVNAAMILIGTQAAEGTVYHEAFHAVVQFLLTDDEINSLFEAAKKKWGDLLPAALEERMADEFENYMKGLDPNESKIKRFFKELWNAIQAWLGKTGYIESLYRDINTGVYANRDVRDDRSNALNSIRSDQRDHTKDYDFLTSEEKERLRNTDISKSQWNQLTKKQQEYMLHCVV